MAMMNFTMRFPAADSRDTGKPRARRDESQIIKALDPGLDVPEQIESWVVVQRVRAAHPDGALAHFWRR
jgi:hypothetical protein